MHNNYSPYRVWWRYGWGKARNGITRLAGFLSRLRSEEQKPAAAYPEFHVYTENSLRKLLAAENLETEDVFYFDFDVFLPPLDQLFPRASVHVSNRLERLCRSSIKGLGTAFIIKAVKVVDATRIPAGGTTRPR